MSRFTVVYASLCLLTLAGPRDAQAQVVIETVTVANPGNAGENSGESEQHGLGPDRICGAVDYVFNLGTFEVTAGQYTEFLNAVDPLGSNPYGIYNGFMDSNLFGCQITWNAGITSYDFSGRPSGTEADWADRPVNYVSWGDAARFSNWMHNGQPIGQVTEDPTQDADLTEDGSYYLNGATTGGELMAIVRDPDATWVIPSEDEWYKAAYYVGAGMYFDFATGSDVDPSNLLIDPDPGNNATFFQGGQFTIGSPFYRTAVGAHENSGSPYATFDQGGNAWEWTEAVIYGSSRGIRGGSFHYFHSLHAAYRFDVDPSNDIDFVGFRVAQVTPPPIPTVSEWGLALMTLLVLATGAALIIKRRAHVPDA